MMPSYMVGSGIHAMPGTAVSGHASCHLINMARNPPMMSINSPIKRNCRPIILWSVEKM